MIIQCDQCSARFRLDDSKVTESGVKVRCKRCQHIFSVKKEKAPDAFQEETQPTSRVSDAVSVTVAPAPAVTEAPVTSPSPEEFRFSFDIDAPESVAPPQESQESDRIIPHTASAEESARESSLPGDDFQFSFAEEPPAASTSETLSAPELPGEAAPPETGWDVVEDAISAPQPAVPEFLPAIDSASSPVESEPVAEESTEFTGWAFEVTATAATPPSLVPDVVAVRDAPVAASPEEEVIEEASGPAAAVPDEPVAPPPTETVLPPQIAPTVAPEPVPTPPESPPPATPPAPVTGPDTSRFGDSTPTPALRRQKRSFSAIAGMVLGAVVVLVAGGLGTLYLLKGPDAFTMAGIGKMMEPEKTVRERIVIMNLEGSYVTNREAGELFVIRGDASNLYRTPRAAIQVRGLVYNAAGAVVLEKSIFCGNPLTPEQLATLPLAKIEEAMNNRLGESYANIGVPSGKSVPFVIVFAGMPKDAVDFGVEVTGSQATGQ